MDSSSSSAMAPAGNDGDSISGESMVGINLAILGSSSCDCPSVEPATSAPADAAETAVDS
ncbi:MAG: hypothetical protein R2688_04695 [Fimbriimonadaceae bacterium]